MRISIRPYIIILCIFIFGCNQNGSIEKITICIDPNNEENKKSEIVLSEKDDIKNFMLKLDKKEKTIRKFYPRYSIEIKYAKKSILYLGNSNFIKEVEGGATYELLAKDWEIYKY